MGAMEVRREAGGVVVQGVFQTRITPLAVMRGCLQLICFSLHIEQKDLNSTKEWPGWQEMEEGFQARWRFGLPSDQPVQTASNSQPNPGRSAGTV
jgi:hypothetical protein